jgi:hypothetical protein
MDFFLYLNPNNMQIVRFIVKLSSVLREACNGYGAAAMIFSRTKKLSRCRSYGIHNEGTVPTDV